MTSPAPTLPIPYYDPVYGNVIITDPDAFSPVLMGNEWTKLQKIITLSFIFVFSCHFNTYFVVSFYIEDSLKRVGYSFLVTAGICNMMVALLVFPTVLVVLIADLDCLWVCQGLQTVVQTSCYGFSISFMFIGIETFLRTCESKRPYEIFLKMRMDIISILIMVVSTLLSVVGVFFQLDYDYCNRIHVGNHVFKYTTSLVFFVIPFFTTMLTLFISIIRIQNRYDTDSTYRKSPQYVRDSITTNLNIFSYVAYVCLWLPYTVAVIFEMDMDSARFYCTVCVGLAHSVLIGPFYGSIGSNFRRAYKKQFRYCYRLKRTADHRSQYHRNLREGRNVGDIPLYQFRSLTHSSNTHEVHSV